MAVAGLLAHHYDPLERKVPPRRRGCPLRPAALFAGGGGVRRHPHQRPL